MHRIVLMSAERGITRSKVSPYGLLDMKGTKSVKGIKSVG